MKKTFSVDEVIQKSKTNSPNQSSVLPQLIFVLIGLLILTGFFHLFSYDLETIKEMFLPVR